MTSTATITKSAQSTTTTRLSADARDETTVVVVDTQQMIASGLSSVLATFERLIVVGSANTPGDAYPLVGKTRPDVVILDARIDAGAEAAVRRFADVSPRSVVLVLGLDESVVDIARMLIAGAGGYVTKNQPIEELVAAVFDVHAGRRVIAPELLDPLLDHVAHGAPIQLSQRQQCILQLLAEGSRPTDIAAALSISVSTLRNQLRGLLVRLGAHSQLEAVAIARRRGLLPHVTTARELATSRERSGS